MSAELGVPTYQAIKKKLDADFYLRNLLLKIFTAF